MKDFLVIAAIKHAMKDTSDLLLHWLLQDWLVANWHMMEEATKTEIRRCIEKAFEDDYEQMQETSWPVIRKFWIGE